MIDANATPTAIARKTWTTPVVIVAEQRDAAGGNTPGQTDFTTVNNSYSS